MVLVKSAINPHSKSLCTTQQIIHTLKNEMNKIEIIPLLVKHRDFGSFNYELVFRESFFFFFFMILKKGAADIVS